MLIYCIESGSLINLVSHAVFEQEARNLILVELIDMGSFAKPENALKRAEGKWQIFMLPFLTGEPSF